MNEETKNLPVNWQEQFAKEAKEVASLERPAVSGISFRSGIMSYAGNEIPGNSIAGVALAYIMEHAYYPDAFDPDNPTPPDCFAIATPENAGRDGIDMIPSEESADKQAETCASCPHMKWVDGRKACKQIRKIAFVPFSDEMTAEQVEKAEVAVAKIPVTSVKNWKNYINFVAATENRPPWAVVTRLSTKPHAKHQFHVNFALEGLVPDHLLSALNSRIPSVQEILLTPYSYPEEEVVPVKKGKKKY